MTKSKRMLSFLLILTLMLTLGEGFALADEPVSSTPAPAPQSEEELLAAEAGGEEAPEATAEPESAPEPEEPPVPATEEPAPTETPAPTKEPVSSGWPVIPVPATEEPEATPVPECTEAPEEAEEAEEPAEHKEWPWTAPGNDIGVILGGGRTLVSGDKFYYAENGIWLEQNGESVMLSNMDGANLNLCGQWLYFSAQGEIWRVNAAGGTPESVYSAESFISEMYVMGDEVRFLVDGGLYSYDMQTGALETLPAVEGAERFIPTPYGNLFMTGEIFHMDLWAGESKLLSDVDSCYPDGDWLVVVNESGTWQTPLAGLFQGSVALQEYDLHQAELAAAETGLSDEEQLANEAAYLDSAEFAAIQAPEQSANSGIMTLSVPSTVMTSKDLSANQQNIVLRAEQHANVIWNCLKNRTSWRSNSVKATDGSSASKFVAGKSYKGIPYAQAVENGAKYVGWNISLSDFLKKTSSASSEFYSKYSTYGTTAPLYGSDCSGFVSYAWDLPYRCTCTSLLDFSKYIGKDVQKIQVGDCLNKSSSHVVLVTDLGYNAKGEIVSVEITEQTPPKMKVTLYGEDLSNGRSYDAKKSLSTLTSSYLNNGYSIYRRKCSSKPNVAAPEAVPGLNTMVAPTATLTAVGPGEVKVTLAHEKGSQATIYYTTDGSVPSTSGETSANKKYTEPFTVKTTAVIRAAAIVSKQGSLPLYLEIKASGVPNIAAKGSDASSVFNEGGVYYIEKGKDLVITADSGADIYYTTNGDTPTMSSSKFTSSTSIKVPQDGSALTLKTFAVNKSGGSVSALPSAVQTYTVKAGAMHTITVNDLYGFISPTGGTFKVLDGASVSFKINKTVKAGESGKAYELASATIKSAGGESTDITNKGTYTIMKVTQDYTVTAKIKSPYADVKSTSWYTPYVAYCDMFGLMNGTDSDKFEPLSNMTRAMFVTVLGRYAAPRVIIDSVSQDTPIAMEKVDYMLGVTNGTYINVRKGTSTSTTSLGQLDMNGEYLKVLSAVNGSDGGKWYKVSTTFGTGYIRKQMPDNSKTLLKVCEFNDVTMKYARGYAQWAYLSGILNGESATTFGAKHNILRQDVCVILYNYLTKYAGYSSLSTSETKAKKLYDYGKVSSYAKKAVCAMANIGLIEGNSKGYFEPLKPITRAEAAVIFMRLDAFVKGQSIP